MVVIIAKERRRGGAIAFIVVVCHDQGALCAGADGALRFDRAGIGGAHDCGI